MKDNIFEWIYDYFQQDEDAFALLRDYFRPITIAIIYTRLCNQALSEDTRSEYILFADRVLNECLIRCRTDRYQTFKAFYRRVLNNRLIDYLKKETNHSLEFRYTVIYLDELIDGSDSFYFYQVESTQSLHLHEDVMDHLELESTLELMTNFFSSFELEVLSLKRLGYSTKEIASQMNISNRRVLYILNKIKKWLLFH